MSATAPRPSSGLWIGGPWIDLVCFSLGWIPAFAAFVVIARAGLTHGTPLLFLSILVFNFLHRHLTFPLVYGDPEQLARHRRAYLVLPPLFLGVTIGSFFWWEGLFFWLQTAAVVWTMYHTVMQKIGLLRIYSRKSGAGQLWLDKALPLIWLGFLALHGAADPSRRHELQAFFGLPASWSQWLEVSEDSLRSLELLVLAVASVLTVLYVRAELAKASRASWPKLVYAGSIGLLYATFFYDVGVGFVVFSFSHAIEYIAFVNLYSRKRYLAQPPRSSFLARVVRHQLAAMLGYALLMVPAFLFWNELAPLSLEVYIVGSGFLHFIYDGWIWKTREPAVGQPLGIAYPAARA